MVGMQKTAENVIRMVQQAKTMAQLDPAEPLASLVLAHIHAHEHGGRGLSWMMYGQGLSLSGMELEPKQVELVALLRTVAPLLSAEYHVCDDTMGALATGTENGMGSARCRNRGEG